MELKMLREQYSFLAKKYSLPSFNELNEDFEIDKIDRESDTLIRVVRKVMMEKIVNSLTFLEMLINPVNTPRIYFSYIRSITPEDKKIIDELYTIFGELSISSLDLEIDYSEKKESDVVRKIYSTWKATKPNFRVIIANMRKPNGFTKKEKSYFG
ncbi:hypothetical protein KW787_03545 [Candidatus Pacearchaeota archaeon]|nr:hypothetical protein [Candidatus Pacearchaeota archaeon]